MFSSCFMLVHYHFFPFLSLWVNASLKLDKSVSFNCAFKWFALFALDQTSSSNILRHEQVFYSTSANEACGVHCVSWVGVIISAVTGIKWYLSSFKHCLPV